MASFSKFISEAEAENIRQYVLSEANQTYEKSEVVEFFENIWVKILELTGMLEMYSAG